MTEYITTNEDVTKLKIVSNFNGVFVDRVSIPQTHTSYKTVFFVSDINGNEYGQYPTLDMAKAKHMEVR